MKTFKALLLLLAFTWQEKAATAATKSSSTSTAQTTTTPASPYKVVCTSTEEAILTLTDKSYKAVFPKACNTPASAGAFNYTLDKSCLGKTIIIDKIPSGVPKLIGGDGTIAFNITCDVPPDGVTVTPNIDVKMASPVSPTVESHPFTAVQMTLTKSDPTNDLTAASQASLGQHLYLVIMSETNTAGVDNVLIPESCSAKGGTGTVDLWNKKSGSGAKCGSLQPTLLGNFTVDETNTVKLGGKKEVITYADLYAFKFKDSDTITYKCTVLVCPKNGKGSCSTELATLTSNKCLKTTTRKRRSIESQQAVSHVRKTVSATLTVSDFQGLSEGNQARVEGLLMMVAMVTSLFVWK